MDYQSTRFTWSRNISVQALAKPDVQFGSVEDSSGNSWTTKLASGSYNRRNLPVPWLLTNDANVPWSPSVNAYTDPGLFADCDDVGQVTSGSFVPLTCTLL